MNCRTAVSVLLPFYQAASTLPAALASLRRQTVRDWRCVLVDDGSSDLGPALAREAVRADPRFELLSLGHGGLVAALNAGLERCTAPLVARMDADDVMHRSRLALQVAALAADEGLAGVGCHVRIFPRRGLSDGLREYERWLGSIDGEDAVRREAFVESPLVHPTLVLRRQVLAETGYRDAGWPEDYDLLLRLLGRGSRLGVVPRRLLSWRDSPARLTRTGDAYRLERHTACKASFLAEGLLRPHADYILWGHGSTGSALRRALKAHGKRPAFVIELHPGRLGQRIEGAPVVRPEEIPALPRLPLVASVAGAGPRGEIRAFLAAHGFVEGRDFVCAA